MRAFTSAAVFTLLLVVAAPAGAHELWLDPAAGGGLVLNYGHARDAEEGPRRIEYRPEWIREALCVDPGGHAAPVKLEAAYPVRLPGPCAAAYVRISSGYWTKTPYGTKNEPPAAGDQVVDSWLSFESTKRIERWSPALAEPLASGLELTPTRDPTELRPGEKLRLLVTLAGKPVAGAVVAYDDSVRGQSDSEGRINVRIRHRGLQWVTATLEQPDPSGKARRIVRTTTLNFVAGKEEQK
ncbi:MAG: DUF4198 domain-containing protein [Candidatus Dadabacteria bacterium]|nr:MAG: DUF4198 domain-containing protein [Candidatus Dadabacteria bacterium]